MKLLAISFFSLTLVLAADPPKKAPAPITIPASAVKADDGSYHYTDKDGKKWIYRKTPFGIARMEDKPAEIKPADADAAIKATEDGEVIKFERPGPFGAYKWERKKSELTESEQAIWKREQAKAAKQN
jgi:hypothetical protein